MTLKRFIISLYIGLISLMIISISFSLAWFTASSHLFINTIDVSVRGEPTLLISTDNDEYNEKITYNDKDHLGNYKLHQVEEFIPVSSMMSDRWMGNEYPKFYDCSSDLYTEAVNPPEMKIGFYQQKFYLKTNIDYYASLDLDKTKINFNHELNKNHAPSIRETIIKEMNARHMDIDDAPSIDEIVSSMDDLIYSLRISFYFKDEYGIDQYFIYDPYKEDITIYGGLLDNRKDGYYDTFINDDNHSYELLYGDINDRELIIYDEPTALEDIDLGKNIHYYGNSFNAIHRQSAFNVNLEKSKDNGLLIKEEQSISNEDILNNVMLIPLYRDVPKEVVISIYLEGWDKDLFNKSQGSSFDIDVVFKLVKGGLR